MTRYPADTGYRVAPDSLLIAQIHYNLAASSDDAPGVTTTVHARLAESVEREGFFQLPDPFLDTLFEGTPASLEPGREAVEYTWELSIDDIRGELPGFDLFGVLPHMHGYGRSLRFDVVHADDSETCGIDVPNWDFDWQLYYFYETPLRLGAGDRVRVTCTYDTRAASEPVLPGWGSGDEMCLPGAFMVPALEKTDDFSGIGRPVHANSSVRSWRDFGGLGRSLDRSVRATGQKWVWRGPGHACAPRRVCAQQSRARQWRGTARHRLRIDSRPMTVPSDASLDHALTAQIVVAWAGESGEDGRLRWWNSDLVSEYGGKDLFMRLLPNTWDWAVLQAAREAARRHDETLRKSDHNADRLLSLFALGFAIDERLDERLQDLKRSGQTTPEALPGLVETVGEDWTPQRFATWVGSRGKVGYETAPTGRRLRGAQPESLEETIDRLVGALAPLADAYPLPHFLRTV